ncbi:MAG: MBL fold metallo-hydrolase [Bacteroidales bacterium]|nr:MBL fold metallo-hydrolase [Bacteroidales bacterium]
MKKSNIILILIIAGLMFQSCITIKHSSLRMPNPESIEVENCKISSTGAVYLNLFGIIKSDLMPAGIKVELDSITLYIDPLVVDDTIKADYIFITHNHLDHFSKADIDKLIKPETILIGPKTITKKYKNNNTKTVSIGEKKSFGKIKYEVVESYNIKSKLHKKGSKYVGYVISCDTTRIYIAGDTDFIPEMKELENITVAIIPIGEGKTAMNPQSAANAANLINPEIVIPIHYELGQNREKDFLELVDKNIEVKFFQIKN